MHSLGLALLPPKLPGTSLHCAVGHGRMSQGSCGESLSYKRGFSAREQNLHAAWLLESSAPQPSGPRHCTALWLSLLCLQLLSALHREKGAGERGCPAAPLTACNCVLDTGPGEKKAESSRKKRRMVENKALDTLQAAPCLPLCPGQGHGWQNTARRKAAGGRHATDMILALII